MMTNHLEYFPTNFAAPEFLIFPLNIFYLMNDARLCVKMSMLKRGK